MFLAVLCGDGEDVRDGCCSVNEENLLKASSSGDVTGVCAEINLNTNINCVNELGCSPLFLASMHGHYRVVSLLLQHRADINQLGPSHWSALHMASFYGHLTVVALLLCNGASTTVKNDDGFTPGCNFDPAISPDTQLIIKNLVKAEQNLQSEGLSKNQLQDLLDSFLLINRESDISEDAADSKSVVEVFLEHLDVHLLPDPLSEMHLFLSRDSETSKKAITSRENERSSQHNYEGTQLDSNRSKPKKSELPACYRNLAIVTEQPQTQIERNKKGSNSTKRFCCPLFKRAKRK